MNPPRSSISNSEPTLRAIPWPSAAAYIAVATILCCGAFLNYIGGGMYGELPKRTPSGLVQEAYRFNSKNLPADDQVLLLGNSLLLYGVLEDELNRGIGKPKTNVISLALEGATVQDFGRLVGRLDPSRATQHRVAVIQIHRRWFTTGSKVWPTGLRAALWKKLKNWKLTASPARFLEKAAGRIPERHELTGEAGWIDNVKYGWLASHYPTLVEDAQPRTRGLWSATDSMLPRMTAGLKPVEYALEFENGAFEENALGDLRALISQLKAKSYRVVLLMPPFHSDFFASLAKNATGSKVEDQFRSILSDRSSTGADAVIEFRDSSALDSDDSIFYDYGHLRRKGATLLTGRLAQALLRSGFLDER